MAEPTRTLDRPTLNRTADSPTINVQVTSEDLLRTTLSSEFDNDHYFAFGVLVNYHTDEGLRGSPVAAARGSGRRARFWRVHSGFTTKVVTWVAQNLNRPPKAPHPDTGSANDVLLDKDVGLPTLGVMPDGSAIYTLMGRYVYGLQETLADTDQMSAGQNPFTNVHFQNKIRVEDFTRGILYGTPNPAGFSGSPITY